MDHSGRGLAHRPARRQVTLALVTVAAIGSVWLGCGGEDEEESSPQASAPTVATTAAAEDETGKNDSKPADRKPRGDDETERPPRPSPEAREKAKRLRDQLIETIRDNPGDFGSRRERVQRIRKKLQRLRRQQLPAGYREEQRQDFAEHREEKEAEEDEGDAEQGSDDRAGSD